MAVGGTTPSHSVLSLMAANTSNCPDCYNYGFFQIPNAFLFVFIPEVFVYYVACYRQFEIALSICVVDCIIG